MNVSSAKSATSIVNYFRTAVVPPFYDPCDFCILEPNIKGWKTVTNMFLSALTLREGVPKKKRRALRKFSNISASFYCCFF